METTIITCPICGQKEATKQEAFDRRTLQWVACARCGTFGISRQLVIFEDVKKKVAKVSHLLSGLARELKETRGIPPTFTLDTLDETLRHPLIPQANSIEEKIKKLLQRLREKTEEFGQEVDLGDIETVVSLAYAKSSNELIALFALMTEKKLAKIGVVSNERDDGKRRVRIALSANGWQIAESQEKKNKESDRGFIAIWFDDTREETIKVLEQTIDGLGYRSVCIKHEHYPETIMEKALGEIRNSRFVVADLTGERVDVAFEAGFAFGLGIEVIYVYDKRVKDELPKGFYSKHFQCHGYSGHDELRDIIKAAIGARMGFKSK